MTPDERRKVAQLVAGIVVTDDVLDPAEERFVDKMLDNFGIPDDQRAVIFPILDGDEAAESLQRMSGPVQAEVIELLIGAAAADGDIVPEERAYLAAVAKAAGVSDEQMEQRLAAALSARASASP